MEQRAKSCTESVDVGVAAKNKTIYLTDHKLSVVAEKLGLGEVDISSTEGGGQHSAAGEDKLRKLR